MADYYNPYNVISKQRTMSMIIGPRGYGKTYGFKKFMMDKAIKGKGKFIYLRRKKSEVDEVIDLFGDLKHDPKFEGLVFKQQGGELYFAEDKDENDKWVWHHIGSIMALSLEANFKSREFSEYKYLLFDEWLPLETNGFLKKELKKFQSFIDTVFRDRSDFQIFCVGNSSILFNPYFEEFGIYPNILKEYTYHRDKERSMLIQVITSKEWSEYRETTTVGKLFKGTEYSKYANDNKFDDDDDSLVEDKPASAKNIMVFSLDSYTVGVWFDRESGKIYFSDQYNPGITEKFAFDYDDLDEEYQSYRNLFESHNIKLLKIARRNGKIRFTSKKSKAHSRLVTDRLKLL